MQTDRNPLQTHTRRSDPWDRRVAAIEYRLARAEGPMVARLRNELARVKRKKRDVQRRLREAAHSGGVDWEDVRSEVRETTTEVNRLAARNGEERVVVKNHEDFIRVKRREARRWSRHVDRLLEAFHTSQEPPPNLGVKLEALRNKRDTAITKVDALEHHRRRGWPRARKELNEALEELRDSWRTVLGALDKETIFI